MKVVPYQMLDVGSVPIYHSHMTGEEYDNVQKELSDVYDKLEFAQQSHWKSHHLSDPTFQKNMIEDYKLEHMKQEVKRHVRQYLMAIPSILWKNDIRIMSSWMTQTLHKEYAHIHDHSFSDISGAYYFKTNGEDGDIFFPAPLTIMGTSVFLQSIHDRCNLQVSPTQGGIILFPGWLKHGVRTNMTDNERLSVSFNVKIVL